MNRKPLLILLSIIVAGLAAGCILKYSRQSHAREYSRQFFAMDTVMSFTAYGERGEEAVEAAVQEVERLDALLSTGIAESEVSRINASGAGDLSEDTEKILSEGLAIWKQTGGLFDVTIYPLMQLWGFPTGNYHVPTEEELKQTMSLVDSSKVILDGNHVTLGEKQKMDLGGIAKGYTSNRIMEIFQEYGVTSAMVSLGGNVQTLGKKPDGTDWQVGIQNPDNVQGDLLGAVAVQDQAVITSGGYERYFEENGQTYKRFDTAFWSKAFYPLAILVMLLLSMPFAYQNARAGGMAIKIFCGIMIGIFYYALNNLFAFMSALDSVPSIISAILPSVMMTLAAIIAMWYVERRS